MPAFTATTTPQRIFKSYFGTQGNSDSVGVQVANGVTGTVYIAESAANCVVGETVFITEDTAVFSTDSFAGRELWVVADGSDTNIVWTNFGPTPVDYTPAD